MKSPFLWKIWLNKLSDRQSRHISFQHCPQRSGLTSVQPQSFFPSLTHISKTESAHLWTSQSGPREVVHHVSSALCGWRDRTDNLTFLETKTLLMSHFCGKYAIKTDKALNTNLWYICWVSLIKQRTFYCITEKSTMGLWIISWWQYRGIHGTMVCVCVCTVRVVCPFTEKEKKTNSSNKHPVLRSISVLFPKVQGLLGPTH